MSRFASEDSQDYSSIVSEQIDKTVVSQRGSRNRSQKLENNETLQRWIDERNLKKKEQDALHNSMAAKTKEIAEVLKEKQRRRSRNCGPQKPVGNQHPMFHHAKSKLTVREMALIMRVRELQEQKVRNLKEEKAARTSAYINSLSANSSALEKPKAHALESRRSPSSRSSQPERIVLREQGTSPIRFERKTRPDELPSLVEAQIQRKPNRSYEEDVDCLSRLSLESTKKPSVRSSGTSPLKSNVAFREQWMSSADTYPSVFAQSPPRPSTAPEHQRPVSQRSTVRKASSGAALPFLCGNSGTSTSYQVQGNASSLLCVVLKNYPTLHGLVKEALESGGSLLQQTLDRLERQEQRLIRQFSKLDSQYDNMKESNPNRYKISEKLVECEGELQLVSKKRDDVVKMLPGATGQAKCNRMNELRLLQTVFLR
ncbi:hypothetical protein L596_023833 [Steinernema carpocapsae]|uniref:Uncharacterized protein n=1 Tax=Steinernema carpocapsae TaxID=34508 RepID=A0A4U5MEU5_STECR|nr:hypothetical protein L596_023833 [Steinernema carpocapsae]